MTNKFDEIKSKSPYLIKHILHQLLFIKDEFIFCNLSVAKTIEHFVNRTHELTDDEEKIMTAFLFFLGKYYAKQIDDKNIISFPKFYNHTIKIITADDINGLEIRKFIRRYNKQLSVSNIIKNIKLFGKYYEEDFKKNDNILFDTYNKKKYRFYEKNNVVDLLKTFQISLNFHVNTNYEYYEINLDLMEREIKSKYDEFNKSLFIFRGISGSGKTTSSLLLTDVSYSQDMFFERYENFTNFNKYEIDYSIKWCLNKVENAMKLGINKIGVNNMFLKYSSIKPYIKLAKKYNYKVFLFLVENINNTVNVHGLPPQKIEEFKKIIEIKF